MPRRWLRALIVTVLLGVGAAATLMFNFASSIEVVNLGPDERVYVSGLRVDAQHIVAPKKGELLVSVAKGGLLYRFGRVRPARKIDADSLPEQRADPKEHANLWVYSDPKGCAVSVDGEHASTTTPVSMEVKAGEEMLVEVMCPGLPRRTQWIMGAPGQEVQVTARMFDDEQ